MSMIIVSMQAPLRIIASITGEVGLVPVRDGSILRVQHDRKLFEHIKAEKVDE